MLYQQADLDTVAYEYDVLGNMTFKSDVGSYNYSGSGGIHSVSSIDGSGIHTQYAAYNRVYEYDNNGNMTAGDGRYIQYASYNKPKRIDAPEGSVSNDWTQPDERGFRFQVPAKRAPYWLVLPRQGCLLKHAMRTPRSPSFHHRSMWRPRVSA